MAWDRTLTSYQTWVILNRIYGDFGNAVKWAKAEGLANTAVMDMWAQILTKNSYGGDVNVASNGVSNTYSSFYSQF